METGTVSLKTILQVYSDKKVTLQKSALYFPYGDDSTFQPRVD